MFTYFIISDSTLWVSDSISCDCKWIGAAGEYLISLFCYSKGLMDLFFEVQLSSTGCTHVYVDWTYLVNEQVIKSENWLINDVISWPPEVYYVCRRWGPFLLDCYFINPLLLYQHISAINASITHSSHQCCRKLCPIKHAMQGHFMFHLQSKEFIALCVDF